MDLVGTIRKEGSRGGRGEFQWSDVQSSQHRENYLGHSLMAPVGRWQKGKDLSWYSKGEGNEEDSAERAKQERIEEIRRVKEAEQEALAKALGYPLMPSTGPETGSNAMAVSGNRAPPTEAATQDREDGHKKDNRDDRGRRHHHHKQKHRSRSPDRNRHKERDRARARDMDVRESRWKDDRDVEYRDTRDEKSSDRPRSRYDKDDDKHRSDRRRDRDRDREYDRDRDQRRDRDYDREKDRRDRYDAREEKPYKESHKRRRDTSRSRSRSRTRR